MRLSLHALQKLGILSSIASLSVLISSPPAWAETLLKESGALSANTDFRLEDGSLYDAYKFSGNSGQQITIILESQDFDPYLILLNPNGERINENDDISCSNLNSRLVVVLPSTGTYTVYANSYDAAKGGQYSITIRTNDRSTLPENLTALFLEPSAQCSSTLSAVVQAIETDREIQVTPIALQLVDQYISVPDGKPDGIAMSLSGNATRSAMASSQIIKYVASSLIRDCTSVGAVAFRPTAYPEERIFGYSPAKASRPPAENSAENSAENPVEEFNCSVTVAPTETTEINPLVPWGQKRCL